ncbi:DUF3606 domain-containing protein [Brevundimonas sp.]|uniref:DUF3606 domain-containing protein n=1 Tax=Brevundimonas sp. TaxID=1871086 RepID=UPI002D290BE3|nr:DUF3606 domain-containing protein [Brevundimonas sp.]HYC96838.1 DUF3606 domain-containing protein [Brevundimonas sp.]
MSEKFKTGGQDRAHVILGEDYEDRDSSQTFGVSGDRLRAAATMVGNRADVAEPEPRGR